MHTVVVGSASARLSCILIVVYRLKILMCMTVVTFLRCLRILEANLVLVVAAKEMRDEPPNKGFIVASVDMLDGLCGAIGASFEALMTADGGKLMPMVLYCMQVCHNCPSSSYFCM